MPVTPTPAEQYNHQWAFMILQPLEIWMREAMDLARLGRGRVEPNPMVGCVIVKAGRVIGRGYHAAFGEAHAEPSALAACEESPAGATAIVTLEPCCHTNKKTPPCVPTLIAAGIGHVIVGTLDPNPAVSGIGIAQLRAAGVQVTMGILERPCRQLIAPWVAVTQLRRPYITLKWAESADGLVAGTHGRPVGISNPAATAAVHRLRSMCDGILVGVNTVLTDDPMLTARDIAILPGTRRCLLTRIILDRVLRTPLTCRLVQSVGKWPVLIFCSAAASAGREAEALRERQVMIQPAPLDATGQLDLNQVMTSLVDRPMTHVLVECGPTLARAFMAANLADRAWVIRSPRVIGEPDAPHATAMPWPCTAKRDLEGDHFTEHLNPSSPAFFSAEASSDVPC